MDKLLIRGGNALHGDVNIAGAKNAALPMLCAALLTSDTLILRNLPDLQDVRTMLKLLAQMGVEIQFPDPQDRSVVTLKAERIEKAEATYEMVKTMRASILVLGPLLARFGNAKVSLPGGCAIGARPVDQHIKGMQKMGAIMHIEHGYIEANAPKTTNRLQGAHILTDMITVTGTENLLMAAVLAEGITYLENAAREPEVTDLALLLNEMGAKISGIGSDHLKIEGVPKLHGTDYQIIADRIETGTFLCAVAATGGEITIHNCRPDTLDAVLTKLTEAGLQMDVGVSTIRATM